ncbi:hypothetical protein UVI_02054410 [Ustilaginoidea virens]|uniref:Uncharacterized protein n=1 Tax=Ustilaginoidea virens TaxID=1159556 RepID=A0A1B5L4T1_USTVR|nr:hypothetical protein UVI_02054410 [Ustilaginoidea virens]
MAAAAEVPEPPEPRGPAALGHGDAGNVPEHHGLAGRTTKRAAISAEVRLRKGGFRHASAANTARFPSQLSPIGTIDLQLQPPAATYQMKPPVELPAALEETCRMPLPPYESWTEGATLPRRFSWDSDAEASYRPSSPVKRQRTWGSHCSGKTAARHSKT